MAHVSYTCSQKYWTESKFLSGVPRAAYHERLNLKTIKDITDQEVGYESTANAVTAWRTSREEN
jgi:hypothetical protein